MGVAQCSEKQGSWGHRGSLSPIEHFSEGGDGLRMGRDVALWVGSA